MIRLQQKYEANFETDLRNETFTRICICAKVYLGI